MSPIAFKSKSTIADINPNPQICSYTNSPALQLSMSMKMYDTWYMVILYLKQTKQSLKWTSMGCYVILLDFFAKIDFLVSFCSSWPVDYDNFGCHFFQGVKCILFSFSQWPPNIMLIIVLFTLLWHTDVI